MKKVVLLLLVLGIACGSVNAQVFGEEALYVGGTILNAKAGSMGKLNLTAVDSFAFDSGGGHVSIPYARIESYEYSRKLAHRAGVIPTIVVVAILKHRHRRHFVTISFKDEQGVPQVAVFEVSKDMPAILMPVLQARAPRASASRARAERRIGQ